MWKPELVACHWHQERDYSVSSTEGSEQLPESMILIHFSPTEPGCKRTDATVETVARLTCPTKQMLISPIALFRVSWTWFGIRLRKTNPESGFRSAVRSCQDGLNGRIVAGTVQDRIYCSPRLPFDRLFKDLPRTD